MVFLLVVVLGSAVTAARAGAEAKSVYDSKKRSSADWPMDRGDAGRSGYSVESLPGKLCMHWRRASLHAPRPAWLSRDTRMPFDRAYRTVIADGVLFFGSSADCKVYALDAATGSLRWEFFTDGPVRFAPAVFDGRVFAVSDDGYLYCLATTDGRLLWKLRGGPADDMLLGNDRIVSRWPARGGPVVADGVVYFAAGIWPSEGIFIHAVDAANGKALWCNDSSGSIHMPQPHGGAEANSGVSAQGQFVVTGERLLVPTGRAVPAAFRRSDGKLLYFHLQANRGTGGSEVVAARPLFLNGDWYFDTATGRPVGKGIRAAAAAMTPDGIVHVRAGAIALRKIGPQEIVDRKGNRSTVIAPGKPIPLAECPCKRVHSIVVAGETIAVGGEKAVYVWDMASKRVVLSAELDGSAYGLAVADGRLVVSTDRGTIYCFGAERTGEPTVIRADPVAAPYGENRSLDAAVEETLRQAGTTSGYCLDLCCGDGALAYALAKRTSLSIYAVDNDPEKVAAARRKLDAAGLYGVRVTVHCRQPDATCYPNYFANLIVSGRSVAEGVSVVPEEETQRLLRPCGGTACLGKPGNMQKTVRGALQGAGSWTHQYCDPANTNCSSDLLAEGPLGMLWFTDLDFPVPSRHGRGPAPMFHAGRLFVEGIDALRCVDAYNGRTLWEYPLPGILKAFDQEHLMGTAGTGSNCCVTSRAVYVRSADKCLRIDPAKGSLLGTFEAPKTPNGNGGTWAYSSADGDTLFGSLADTEHRVKYRYGRSDMSTQFTESVLLFALNATTGELKWTYRPQRSIRNNGIAVGNGRVVLIDRELARRDDARRGDPKAEHAPGILVALDAETGEQQWKVDEGVFGTMLAMSPQHDALLMSYQNTRFKLDSEIGDRMACFRASDGQRLWDVEAQYASRPIINDRTIYAQPGAWDLLTGERKEFRFSRSYGCGILSGSRHLLVYRSATLGYTDLRRNAGTENYGGIRPGCWINAIPAGGLVLMPDATDRCSCSYLIKASIALQPIAQPAAR